MRSLLYGDITSDGRETTCIASGNVTESSRGRVHVLLIVAAVVVAELLLLLLLLGFADRPQLCVTVSEGAIIFVLAVSYHTSERYKLIYILNLLIMRKNMNISIM